MHVLGAGGIGVVVAWCLMRAGREVTVVETRQDKLEAGRKEGLTVAGHASEFPAWIGFADWAPPRDAVVLLCTKTYDNAAISPLAAAAGVDNGELLTDRLAKRLFFALLPENYAILRHARVPLARIGPFHPDTVSRILRTPGLPSILAVFFRPSLRGTYCSMAPDLGTGRTEIEAYNGHLIRLAGSFPCPLNRAALALIERIVRERLSPDRAHLEGLRNLLM